jgi:murein endopeptidase
VALVALVLVCLATTASALASAVRLTRPHVTLRSAAAVASEGVAVASAWNRSGRSIRFPVLARDHGWLQVRYGPWIGWLPGGSARTTTLPADPVVHCSRSRSPGTWNDGRLVDGVLFPREGESFFTWSFRKRRKPNPPRTRWGTCKLVRTILRVSHAFHRAHPTAPRLTIGDLSLRHGGEIDGHASHERGLDVDVYYPRRDGRERPPARVAQIDHALSQELVRRFVRERALKIFVGPNTGLTGPRKVVQILSLHDDHMHVRLRP